MNRRTILRILVLLILLLSLLLIFQYFKNNRQNSERSTYYTTKTIGTITNVAGNVIYVNSYLKDLSKSYVETKTIQFTVSDKTVLHKIIFSQPLGTKNKEIFIPQTKQEAGMKADLKIGTQIQQIISNHNLFTTNKAEVLDLTYDIWENAKK